MQIPRGFSFRRKLPCSSKIFLSIAAACAIASFLLVRGDAARAGAAGAASGPIVDVVVASHDIQAGATLTSDDLRAIRMPEAYAPPGAVGTVDDAIGLVAGAQIADGEPLSAARLGRSALAGSVAAGRSFSQIVSGESNRPIVLPRLFDILAWPSSPRTRFVLVRSGCGSGKKPSP